MIVALSNSVNISAFSSSYIFCQLERICSCVSYQIFSPVIHIHVEHRLSPLQLLSSQGMTQFLFIIIRHSLPTWIDYTKASPCPQFNFLPGGMCYIAPLRKPNDKKNKQSTSLVLLSMWKSIRKLKKQSLI